MADRIIRNKYILIRVSEKEYDSFKENAKKSNKSVSEYIRQMNEEDRIIIVPGVIDLAKQVSKIGTNLNQLTVLAHQGRIKEVDLFPTKDVLQQILREIKKINKKKYN